MAPNQKAENGDRDTGKRDERIAERLSPRERTDDFTNHAHGRHNHDVNRGMRVEPEKVLEQDGIAAEGRVEDSDMKTAFHGYEQEGHRDYRRAEDLDHGGGVMGPDEQGQAEPTHAGGPHPMNSDDEVQAGEN